MTLIFPQGLWTSPLNSARNVPFSFAKASTDSSELRLALASSLPLAVNKVDREITEATVKPFSAIPGPEPLPLLRNALEFKNNLSTLHVYFDGEKYGEIFKLEAPGMLAMIVLAISAYASIMLILS